MKTSTHSSPFGESIDIPAPRFRWGTRVALPVGILLAFGVLFAGSMAASFTPAVEVEAAPVVERPVIQRTPASETFSDGEVVVQAAGWIEPDPFPVHASTLTDGTVKDVLFLEGDAVAEGDVLARLIEADAFLALQRAQAEARAAEEAWDANIESRRAASVAAAIVRETLAALELANAELEVEEARLREAERIFDRRTQLVDQGSISKEEFDIAEATAGAQTAKVRVVKHRIEELTAKLDRVKAEEDAARQLLELRTEERRRLDLARVALAEAQLRVDRLEIKSPIDGVVMRRYVEPGTMLMALSENAAMAKVAALYDPRLLQVRVDVPLADAAKIGVGQPARVTVEVLPDRTFSAFVTRITNLADIQKNTLEVKVALDDPAPELKPDMLARVRFLKTTQPQAERRPISRLSVFAPGAAVREGHVWVVSQFDGEEGIAIRRSVATKGAEHDDWLEIESGLQPGDLVIVSSTERLQPNQRVRVRGGGNE